MTPEDDMIELLFTVENLSPDPLTLCPAMMVHMVKMSQPVRVIWASPWSLFYMRIGNSGGIDTGESDYNWVRP